MWYLIIFVWTQAGVSSQSLIMDSRESCVEAQTGIINFLKEAKDVRYMVGCDKK